MTKKLYYDCPIKAMYMDKYFNVKSHQFTRSLDTYKNIERLKSKIDFLELPKFYIKEICYSIFEPKEGDIIKCHKKGLNGWFVNKIKNKWCIHQTDKGEYKTLFKDAVIINRDYMQFFMPEVENED